MKSAAAPQPPAWTTKTPPQMKGREWEQEKEKGRKQRKDNVKKKKEGNEG